MDKALSGKIKATGDLIHELDIDNLDLTNDEVIAVAVELLELTVLATYDGNDDAIAKRTEKIKESVIGMVGDADKTAAFIKATLTKTDGGVVNG